MSRSDARSDSLRHRPARIVPASIVAVVLLALGVGLVWVSVLKLSNGSWPAFLGTVDQFLAGLTWGAAIALAITIAVAVVGLILLIAAIKPGTPNAMLLKDQTGANPNDGAAKTEFVMTRRAVAKIATATATLIDGVDSVSTTASAHRVTVSVKTPSEQTAELDQSVTQRVSQALDAAGLSPMPRVRAKVKTTAL